MAKTNEELNQLKEEFQALTIKFQDLTEEELNIITGGNNIILTGDFLGITLMEMVAVYLMKENFNVKIKSRFEDLVLS